MPKRIQRKRTKGWRMPPNAIYVGRPSKWGNPWTGDMAVESFEHWITGNERSWVWATIDQLRGKDLVCWCPLDKPCHADVLLRLANEEKK